MSRVFAFFCAVAVLLIFDTSVRAEAIAPRDGWRVIETTHTFSALVDRLKIAIKAEKMGLVTQASASVGAKAQGIVIPGNRVLGVYRNDYARRMLNASLAAGIEAPIRFYVTENKDGTATLSWKTPVAVFSSYLDEGGDDLRKLARELDGVFEAIAKRAVSG
ncbi:DUF302 domain-containing protein [Roseibium sp.]|uniref:DUF302 domain-containing protein n=1 Tax=Roseibium sp. TaxID=1936156 RepID=UPI003A98843C